MGYYRYGVKDGVTKNIGHNLGQDAKLKREVKCGVMLLLNLGQNVGWNVIKKMGWNMGCHITQKHEVKHGAVFLTKTWGKRWGVNNDG